MSRQPWPSQIADAEHAWDELCCSDCKESIGAAASFDASRLPEAILCAYCGAWRELRCARCGIRLGGTPSPHRAPVLLCSRCVANDQAAARARAAREAAAQEPGEPVIADPVANVSDDPEVKW